MWPNREICQLATMNLNHVARINGTGLYAKDALYSLCTYYYISGYQKFDQVMMFTCTLHTEMTARYL